MRICHALSLSIALAAAAPAQAQIAGRTSIDAAASFEDAPDPPLELKGQQPVTFGRVTIPNGVNKEAACMYEIESDNGGANARGIASQAADGVKIATNAAGCAFKGVPDVGIVQVRCREGLPLTVAINYRPGNVPGASFGSNIETRNAGQYGTARGASGRRSGTLPKHGTIACTTTQGDGIGEAYLFINGLLYVTQSKDLPRGNIVTVGSVQIDVSY